MNVTTAPLTCGVARDETSPRVMPISPPVALTVRTPTNSRSITAKYCCEVVVASQPVALAIDMVRSAVPLIGALSVVAGATVCAEAARAPASRRMSARRPLRTAHPDGTVIGPE